MLKLSYDECIAYLERYTDIRLLPFQKEMLKALCEGAVLTSRCVGRTATAKAFARYATYAYERSSPKASPKIAISWEEAMNVARLDS